MKAARIKTYGDASVVEVVDIDRPVAGEGQLLVEVYASSINPYDIAVRSGAVQAMISLTLPVTLGGDIAGIVTAVGPGVTNVAVGDKVYGQANVVAGNSGAFAEYTATAADQVALAPKNLSFTDIASLPLVGASAVQALTGHLEIHAGQKLLVVGGSGGIGSLAIQIAKHLGAYVATTVPPEGVELAQQLGADEVIDYTEQEVTELLHSYDAVFDTAGGDNFTKVLAVLREGGKAVSMIAQADEAVVRELGIEAQMQMTKVTTTVLDRLRELVESGVVRPQVEQVFALADIRAAFAAKERGAVKGKIAINIRE